MLEILVGVLGIAVLVLAYLAYQKGSEAREARRDTRVYQADATVQRARASKYKHVLDSWGGDLDEAERKLEVAGGGKVGPAVDRLRDRLAKLRVRPDKGGGKTGSGGEGGGMPGGGTPPSP